MRYGRLLTLGLQSQFGPWLDLDDRTICWFLGFVPEVTTITVHLHLHSSSNVQRIDRYCCFNEFYNYTVRDKCPQNVRGLRINSRNVPCIIQQVLTEIKMGTAFIYLCLVIVDTLAFFILADIVFPFSARVPRHGDRFCFISIFEAPNVAVIVNLLRPKKCVNVRIERRRERERERERG